MQVQAQLLCTGSRYCDFIVNTKQSVHIERVEADIGFAEENVPKARTFFQTALLPELLSKWFSLPPKQSQLPSPGETEQAPTSTELKYCYCQQGEHGDIVELQIFVNARHMVNTMSRVQMLLCPL